MDGEAVERDERGDTEDYSQHWSTQTGDTGWAAASRPLTPPPGYRAVRTDIASYDSPLTERPDAEHDGSIGTGVASYGDPGDRGTHDAGRHGAGRHDEGRRDEGQHDRTLRESAGHQAGRGEGARS